MREIRLKGDFNMSQNMIQPSLQIIENGFDYLHIIGFSYTNSDNIEIIQDIAKLSNLKIVGGAFDQSKNKKFNITLSTPSDIKFFIL